MTDYQSQTQISYAVLRGRTRWHLFEEESRKKLLLDVLSDVIRLMPADLLAYCILDNESYFVIQTSGTCNAREFLIRVQAAYERNYLPECSTNKLWRSSVIETLSTADDAVRRCVSLHLLPLKRHLVSRPEDYWWCSYGDYFGRQWIPVIQTQIILSGIDEDDRKAMRAFRKQHRKKQDM